jgi:hypothetical protein
MTRLSEIIDAAAADVVPVATLLRQVKVVASRMGTVELKHWVNRELSGYDSTVDLPAYRGPYPAEVIGEFSGPFGSKQALAIPQLGLPEDMRGGWAFQIAFMEPVAGLEKLTKAEANGERGNLQIPWDADMVAYINYLSRRGEAHLLRDHGLVCAYRRVSTQQITAVLDAVRTRVLNLALDLEKVAPSAGDPGDDTSLNKEQVQTIVTNNIYGDGNNLSVGSPGSVQSSNIVKKGDLASLRTAVAATGLPEEDVAAVLDAVQTDESEARAAGATPAPGQRTQSVLGRLALGAGNASGKVATSAAGGIVGGLVRSYFGI